MYSQKAITYFRTKGKTFRTMNTCQIILNYLDDIIWKRGLQCFYASREKCIQKDGCPHILVDQKLHPSSKTRKNRQNEPNSEGCNFWWKKDMKNLNKCLNSAKFKVLDLHKLEYFGQQEKSSYFFFFIFHFRILWKILKR